jgi:hypothetical protein
VERTLALLACLSAFACATRPPPGAIAPGRVDALPTECPYAGVHLAVLSNGDDLEARIAGHMRQAYARHLASSGFEVLETPEGAYWDAFSLVATGGRVHASFAWSVYVMATEDATGERRAPRRFALAGDDTSDLSGFMFLKQVRVHDIESEARKAARATADALLPHAHHMCVSWVEAETVREELAQEMRRVRASQHRQKKLDLAPAGIPNS